MSGGSDEGTVKARARVADIELEDGSERSSLRGFFPADLKILTLQEALAPLADIVPEFAWDSVHVKQALRKAKKIQKQYNHMTLDEISAITLYTVEDEPREKSLYFVMNNGLRHKSRSQIRPWRDFIWLFMNALKKLPPSDTTVVMRGACLKFDKMGLDLEADDVFVWAAFSSVTTTVEVMKTFLGEKGDRTMIQIQLTEKIARDIKDFSFFPSENELLLPPNVSFAFESKNNFGNGFVMVQAKQVETLDPILDLRGEGEEDIATGSGAKAAKHLKAGKTSASIDALRRLLEEVDLASFADKLIEEGFDSVLMLSKISDDALKELGLKLGHIIKLREKLDSEMSAGGSGSQGENKSDTTKGAPVTFGREVSKFKPTDPLKGAPDTSKVLLPHEDGQWLSKLKVNNWELPFPKIHVNWPTAEFLDDYKKKGKKKDCNGDANARELQDMCSKTLSTQDKQNMRAAVHEPQKRESEKDRWDSSTKSTYFEDQSPAPHIDLTSSKSIQSNLFAPGLFQKGKGYSRYSEETRKEYAKCRGAWKHHWTGAGYDFEEAGPFFESKEHAWVKYSKDDRFYLCVMDPVKPP